jgi:signal transduction histidine kinase
MLRDLQKPINPQRDVFAKWTRPWVGSAGLAIAVAIAYFLAARLSLALLTKPDGVAVFWPAAGVAAGVLIALGPGARSPVAIGAMVATIVANLLGDRTLLSAIVFALCNAGEALLTAWIVERQFGLRFKLDSLTHVLGLLMAAIVGTAVSGIGGTIGFKYFQGSTAPILTTWYHWFASDALGIVTIAPMFIGLASAMRDPPPRSEAIEGAIPLLTLTLLSVLIIFVEGEPWVIMVATALLFPLLLWLAARCGPVFSAAAAFIVALAIVCTTTFSIGVFGDASYPISDRILIAQAGILAVSLCAYVLAALFAERRESEARLVRSNMMLERERNNKLMTLEAMTASISHEVRQPLAAIATNGRAALRFLGRAPPDLEEVRSALDGIVDASHRASQIFDNLRALFGSTNQRQESVDVNEIILATLRALRGELDGHGVATRTELTPELPLIMGHSGQLQEVVLNLLRNGIEAMDTIKSTNRVLRVKTAHDGREAISVAVEDTGPGIDPKKLDGIFDAFVTTKPQGMGLGLAICRMIIERHGGQLTASSNGSYGALFRFVLPIKSAVGSSDLGA